MEKITKRDMYEAIIEAANSGITCKYAAEDVIAFCENEIALLDKKSLKARERAAVKAAEGDALYATVADALTDEFQTIADIAAAVADIDPDATVSKVTYRLTQLVKNEVAEKAEMTIPATEGSKARKVQSYRKIG